MLMLQLTAKNMIIFTFIAKYKESVHVSAATLLKKYLIFRYFRWVLSRIKRFIWSLESTISYLVLKASIFDIFPVF